MSFSQTLIRIFQQYLKPIWKAFIAQYAWSIIDHKWSNIPERNTFKW